MTSVPNVGSVLGGWSRKVVLALLVAGALLLCHGVFGAAHQAVVSLHSEHSSHTHPTAHNDTHGVSGPGEQPPVGHQGGDEGGHFGHVAYAAALLVVSLGAALWMPSHGRTWTGGFTSSLTEFVFPPGFLRPPRGPDLPLLQVFRL